MKAHIQKEEEMLNQPYIPLLNLRKWIESNKEMPEDTPITFEFLMTLCFPTILDTVKEAMRSCYDRGFQHGIAAAEGRLEELLKEEGALQEDDSLEEIIKENQKESVENECEDDT